MFAGKYVRKELSVWGRVKRIVFPFQCTFKDWPGLQNRFCPPLIILLSCRRVTITIFKSVKIPQNYWKKPAKMMKKTATKSGYLPFQHSDWSTQNTSTGPPPFSSVLLVDTSFDALWSLLYIPVIQSSVLLSPRSSSPKHLSISSFLLSVLPVHCASVPCGAPTLPHLSSVLKEGKRALYALCWTLIRNLWRWLSLFIKDKGKKSEFFDFFLPSR